MSFRNLLVVTGLSFLLGSVAFAGNDLVEAKETTPDTPFDKGKTEFQLGGGVARSFQTTSRTRPQFTDVDVTARLGRMLYSPSGSGFFRGNTELLIGSYGAVLVEGPGTGYAALSLMLRYNFVQPEARWVPYFQVQAGGVFNDIYKEREQRAFGRSLEFDLGTGLGIHYFWTERFSLFAECNYRHISNANTADRNCGSNFVGGFLGASYFF